MTSATEMPSTTSPMPTISSLQFLADNSNNLQFDDVRRGVNSTLFQEPRNGILTFGMSSATYWIRFVIKNPPPNANEWLLDIAYTVLDSVELFKPQSDGSYKKTIVGDCLPYTAREWRTRSFAFSLAPATLTDTISRQYFLRVRSGSALVIPLELYHRDQFQDYSNRYQILYALVLGTMLTIVFYTIVLLLFTKRRIYAMYGIYSISLICWIFLYSGFGSQLLFREGGIIAQYCTIWAAALSGIGQLAMMRTFLSPKSYFPNLDKLILIFIFIGALAMLGVFIDYPRTNAFVTFIVLPGGILSYSTGLRLYWVTRYRQHLFFLMASIFLIAGALTAALIAFGVLPPTPFLLSALPIGGLLEALLFSFALAQRYRTMQSRTQAAQLESLRMQQERNTVLEQMVEERTKELKTQNTSLEEAHQEIQRQMLIQFEQAYMLEMANFQLKEQNELLNKVNTEKNELLTIVSHDLKNPIGAIMALTEVMNSKNVPTDFRQAALEQISLTSNRMLDFVKNLLDMQRIDDGKMRLRTDTVDVRPLIKSIVHQYEHPAQRKDIHLHLLAEENVYFCIADEQAIMQVLDNLVSNAVKYSPKGKKIVVRVENSHSSLAIGHWSNDNTSQPMTNDQVTNDVLRIEVADEGPGISESDMKKLFGKFARLSARPTGGEHSTGLGLSIVKKMVEAMNGRVWCESELGKGATFIVELPKAS
jgi:signal transduction histidine kinase